MSADRDAAFALRPHAAAGTAKAAADAWALAEALAAAQGDLQAALPRWERRQLAVGRAVLERTRRNADPELVFGLYEPGADPPTSQPPTRQLDSQCPPKPYRCSQTS